MKTTSEHLFPRGKNGNFYIRRRIPTAILSAYPSGKKEIALSLRTSDRAEAMKRFRLEEVRIDAEFASHAVALKQRNELLKLTHVKSLTDEQISGLAKYWAHRVLLRDADSRQNGMTEDEFDEEGEALSQQRAELGKLLARGHVKPIVPAMLGFMHLCGIDAELSAEAAQKAGYIFLESVVRTLDHQLSRQAGNAVSTDVVAPEVIHPSKIGCQVSDASGWDEVFASWQNYVSDRPPSTVIGYQTPWGQLKSFANDIELKGPAELTPKHISAFVNGMKTAGLEVKTINGRIGKLKEIFRIAVGRELLVRNPVENTLGFKESKKEKGEKKRLPFTRPEIDLIFGSSVFTLHLRSSGQAGEASYWIPIMMFYTGARPEELAGLELCDIQHDDKFGWRFDITDLADGDDCLFDDDAVAVTDTEKRLLKNNSSRRQIPVAQELIELGFLRYVEWVRGQGATRLFPKLSKDFHGKLNGAFSKWFGRYKTELGFTSPKKVLYSLRHNMKDFMEAAKIPSKPLKRILGHASGDGTITDGYGSGVPFDVIHEEFSKIQFPSIPALPWQPGVGYWRKEKRTPTTK